MITAPWKYITYDQLLASAKQLTGAAWDANLIDTDNFYSVVEYCNSKLGQRIHGERECYISVENYKAPKPEDLHKIMNVVALQKIGLPMGVNPLLGARQLEFSTTKPEDETTIINYKKIACKDDCDRCLWVSSQPKTEIIIEPGYSMRPLRLGTGCKNKLDESSPCNSWKGEYQVDLINDEFTFSFKEGMIYLCYLGKLVDDDGNLLIPFHPRLTPYYEYAIAESALQTMFLNSDEKDAKLLSIKLKYISDKTGAMYYEAFDFCNSYQMNEWNKITHKLKMDYFKKWYKTFDNV